MQLHFRPSGLLVVRLAFLYMMIGLTPALAQTTRFVSTTGTNTNPATATSWATSTTNLQGAINASASGDAVWMARGTYTPTADINGNPGTAQTRTFRMRTGVQVYGGFEGYENSVATRVWIFGPNNPSPTRLVGNSTCYHVVSFSQVSNCRLDGFRISGGQATGTGSNSLGAGVYNDGSGTGGSSTPNIANCTIETNAASGEGAGLYNNGADGGIASPYLTDCMFTNNVAAVYGGGMANNGSNSGSASPLLERCFFVANSAGAGGGVYNYALQGQTNPTFMDCSFIRNDADGTAGTNNSGVGGGMLTNCRPGSATIQLERCQFNANSAGLVGGWGAAMANFGAMTPGGNDRGIEVYLSNSTATAHVERYYAVFLGFNFVKFFVTNCTIVNNENPNSSTFAPVFVVGSDGSVAVSNCIFWNSGNFTSFTSDPIATTVTYSNLQYCGGNCGPGSTNVSIDPGFTAGVFSLTAGSLLIDAGDPTSTTFTVGPTDLAGSPRIAGCRVDMGAYEYQSPTGTTTPVALSVNNGGVLSCANPSLTLTASGGVVGTGYTFSAGTTPGPSQNQAIVNQAGTYTVTAVNAGGCPASATASVSALGGFLAITQQPTAGLTVCSGTNVAAPVSVTGGVVSYQWYKDGVSLGNPQRGATLSLPDVQTGQAGSYSLVITGSCNSLTSNSFNLTVLPTPVISVQISGTTLIVSLANPDPSTNYTLGVVLDRINGYEIRTLNQNTNGQFPIARPGPYVLVVTNGAGCSRRIEGVFP